MSLEVIIDTDPGIDDSMAILFALQSPELGVIGLTTVFGNTGVEQTTLNALRVLAVAGRADLPLAAGAAAPLARSSGGHARRVHGEDGLGGVAHGLPPPGRAPLAQPAAQFIIQTVLARPGEVTLVALGPLTNLALAARLEPGVVSAVKQVILMGGAAHPPGNRTPVAEANIASDPEAAAVVFSAGWPLTMVGLDVTRRTIMTPAYFDELASVHNPRTDFVARIAPHYLDYYQRNVTPEGVYTHDPSAIAFAIDPSLFRTEPLPIYVETQGRCAGQTVPDPRRLWIEGPDVDVCTEVDSDRLLRLFKERMTR